MPVTRNQGEFPQRHGCRMNLSSCHIVIMTLVGSTVSATAPAMRFASIRTAFAC